MKIAIAGTGYVGLVTGVCLAEVGNENVVCVDVDEQKVKSMKLGIAPIYEEGLEELMVKNYNRGRIDYTTDYKKAYEDVDVILIAVGTPERSDGSNLKNDVKVELASNPEFLSQGTAVKDTLHASRIVIGVESEWAREILEEIYKPFNQPIIVTNRNSAEMIKYASNNFLALKISFMNDIANLCEIAGANIEDVALGMSYDDRIGSKFLKAGIGYGGSCFPKDTKALHWLSEHNGYELKTVKAAIEVNESQKLKLVRKASKLVESFQDMKVAVLGLTFKPDTDDIREAPSIPNIKYLLERGARVTVYDPIGVNNTKKIFGDSILYADSVDDAIEDAEICFIMTEWKDVLNYDIHKYKEKMKNPLVLDGRNCYKIKDMEELGIEYYSIGR